MIDLNIDYKTSDFFTLISSNSLEKKRKYGVSGFLALSVCVSDVLRSNLMYVIDKS